MVVEASRDPLVGQLIGPYRVLKRVGVGGTGALYQAVETNIDKPVALKVVHPHYAANSQLPTLLAEAKAINAIGDRGIVDTFGFGTLPDGRPYLVMELLEGETLDAYVRRQGKLPVLEAVRLSIPVLHALEAAHAAGFVHRDLKPSNIFVVQPKRGERFPKVLDFGLALPNLAEAAIVQGTPDYIAPEQAQGAPASPRSDLYSFGCTLFEMLTGKVPFDHRDAMQVVKMHQTAERPRVRALRPDVPEALDALVLKLMQVRPEDRPASASEVQQALLALLPRSKTWLAVPAAVAIGLLAIGAAVVLVRHPLGKRLADPVAVAVAEASAKVAAQIDGGVWTTPDGDGALERLQTARAAYPGRPEWRALEGQIVVGLRVEAERAIAEGDADRALELLARLGPLEGVDGGSGPLLIEAQRLKFAARNGMVRVGPGFIDAYEYPNRAGAKPAAKVDWAEAVKLCEAAGKHLCSEDEWTAACRGGANRDYPYGVTRDLARCRGKAKGVKGPLPSGAMGGCRTGEGAFDLSGNLAEWTSSPLREGAPQRVLKGGSYFQGDAQLSCGARDYFLPGLGGAAHIGFRCCL